MIRLNAEQKDRPLGVYQQNLNYEARTCITRLI